MKIDIFDNDQFSRT